jgi:dCTP deaminase
MALPDWMIRRDVRIEPFEEGIARPGKVSWGLSSFGMDVRIGYRFKVFTNVWNGVVDPKNFDPKSFVDVDVTPPKHSWGDDGFCQGCGYTAFPGPDQVKEKDGFCYYSKGQPPDHIVIPPNSFALGETIERLWIPRDIQTICVGKSTYARCGLVVNVTPLEAEWNGVVTVEISNTSPLPAKVYAGEGIMQVIFLRSDGYREAMIKHLAQLTAVQDPKFSETMLKDLRDMLGGDAMYKAISTMWIGKEGTACEKSYADKKAGGSKYQNQTGITLPKVD